MLNSSNYFPSRLQIPHASLTHFPSLFRRLSRIFSHAYFHHREAFATSEAETSLYARFAALCQRYELLGAGLLLIPPEGYEMVTPNDDNDDHNDKNDSSDEEGDDADPRNATSVSDKQSGAGATATATSDDASGANASSTSEGREGDADRPAPIEVPGPSESERKDDAKGGMQSQGRGSFSPNRWSGSPVQPPHKGKPAPAQASESLSPPSTRAVLDGLNDSAKVEAKVESKVVSGKGRGTLSRGKAPRASVFAATGPDANASGTFSTSPSSTESALSPSVLGMARKESVESAVYVGDNKEQQKAQSSIPDGQPDHAFPDSSADSKADAVADAPDNNEPEVSAAPAAPANDVTIPIQLDHANDLPAAPAPPPDLSVSPKTTTIPEILAEDTSVSNSPKITKSELLPSPKSELLSISPKNTSASPKRGGKSARGAPRSPKKTKGKPLKKESGSPVPVGEE